MRLYHPTDLQKLNIAATCVSRGNPEQKAIWRIDAPCSIQVNGLEIVSIRIQNNYLVPVEMPNFDSYFQTADHVRFEKEFPIRDVKYIFHPAKFTFMIKDWEFEFQANGYTLNINSGIAAAYINRLNCRFIRSMSA